MCVVIIVQNRHCWTITLWVILLLVHYMKLAGVQNEVWNPPHGERFESLVIGLWLSNFTFSQFRRTLYIVYNIVATEIQRKNAANIRFQVPQCIVYISAFAVSPTSSEIRVRTTFNFKAHVRMNPFKGPNGYYMYRQLKHVKKIHSAYRAYVCISCDYFKTPSFLWPTRCTFTAFYELNLYVQCRFMSVSSGLARPGRKQANVSARMAWISFGALPCRKKYLMAARVSMLLKSRASLTCFRAGFLSGRAKDLSAPR